MALKSMLDGENERLIELDSKAMFVPLNICIIDGYEGRSFRRWGVSENVLNTAAIGPVSKIGRECKE